MPTFVAVSGLPASGKSTVASALAEALQFPFFDKDAFLERLFETEGVGGSTHRRTLSVRADRYFQDAALAAGRAVLASWWLHPKSTLASGTPCNWLSPTDGVMVEVHCLCAASTAIARFLARERHPGHLDSTRSNAELLSVFHQQEHFGPLFPDRAIVVDTERAVVVPVLVAEVRKALRQQGAA